MVKSIDNTQILQKIGTRLGLKIMTPNGEGILIGVTVPFNGLYYEPERARCQVWWGTDEASYGWVAAEYTIDELADLK